MRIRIRINIFKILLALPFMCLISSCQTTGKPALEKPVSLVMEEMSLKKSREAWEAYLLSVEYSQNISMDTFLRLTEEYIEAKETFYKKELENYEKLLDLYNEGAVKTEPIQPKQDYSSLIDGLGLLTRYYRYKSRADALYYALGYMLYEHGRRDEAMVVFEELVENYPASDYFTEVSFRLGEFYFETNQLGDALVSYQRILNPYDSIFYDKSLYKIGWIYYKLDDFKKAADSFMMIVNINWQGGMKEHGLTNEAVSGAVMSLSHFSSIDEAIEYLKLEKTKRYIPIIFMKLGESLVRDTRYEAAISIYNAVGKNFPTHKDLYRAYEYLADLYERTGDRHSAFMAKESLASLCNPTTSWYKRNYPEGSDTVDKAVSDALMSVSKEYHFRGKKGDAPNLQKAVESYQSFLDLFPIHEQSKEINLLLAEALFDTQRYWEAAIEYNRVAPLYNDTSRRADIAYTAFLAYEVVFYQPGDDAKGHIVKYAEQVMEDYKKDLLTAGKWAQSIYKMADMHSHIEAFDRAREKLMLLSRDDREARTALERIAELYLAENNMDEAEKVYVKLFAMTKEAALQEKIAQLRYRIGEEHLKAGRYKDAINKFEKAFNILPNSPIGEAALTKIGQIHLQRGDIDALLSVVELLAKKYPGSFGNAVLLVKAGQGLEEKEPLKAAMLYEKASFITSEEKDAYRLAVEAGIIYEKNKKYEKAENLYRKYMQSVTLSSENKANMSYRLGHLQLKTGKRQEGEETLTSLIKWSGSSNNRLIAKTRLLLMEEKYDTYLQTKLTYPFEETLKKKTQLLDSLLTEYSDIAKLGNSEILPEIFFHMGMVLENFKDSLLRSEKPRDLTEEELEEYIFLMEEKAYPYDEQAVKSYERSIIIYREAQIFNKWTQESMERLTQLRPALYNRTFELKEMEPLFIYPEPVPLGDTL